MKLLRTLVLRSIYLVMHLFRVEGNIPAHILPLVPPKVHDVSSAIFFAFRSLPEFSDLCLALIHLLHRAVDRVTLILLTRALLGL